LNTEKAVNEELAKDDIDVDEEKAEEEQVELVEEEVEDGDEADEEEEQSGESGEGEDMEEAKTEEESIEDEQGSGESEDDSEQDNVRKFDDVEYKRINTLHAEIVVPLSAKSGDVLDVDHDGSKQIKVPKGEQGHSIRVKMIKNKAPETGLFCGCF
jgi:hypothetical protein